MKDATICYLFKDSQVLLQKKAEGKFGAGKWNAPGGKIKMTESPETAIMREIQEETGRREVMSFNSLASSSSMS